jgi:hypothetical protein
MRREAMFLLIMLKDKSLASQINNEIKIVCQNLDASAALVRRQSPQEAHEYAIAIAKVFETIMSEILIPLYQEHPDLAPAVWHEMPESTNQ